MSRPKRDSELELRNLWAALSDSIGDLSDTELLAEMKDAGEDPMRVAGEVRELLRDAVNTYRQRALQQSRVEYLSAVKRLLGLKVGLPRDATGKRNLLNSVLSRRPELVALTAQWRDLKSIPDADLDGILEQLAALGVIDELPPKP